VARADPHTYEMTLAPSHAENFPPFVFFVSIVSYLLARAMRQYRLQILPQAARTGNIAILHRLFRRQCPLGTFIVNERTSPHVKDL